MKKVWMTSILATLMLMVPIISVVGTSDNNEDSVRTTPLFNVRIKRAIDEESKDFSYSYIGKGKEIVLSIPKRNSETVLIQRFTNIISKMDGTIFKKLLNLLIDQILEKNEHEDINEVINTVHQIRNNPKTIILAEINDNTSSFTFEFTPTICWFPSCFLRLLILFIYGFLTFSTVCTFTPPFCTFNCYS